jgi:hypothetical protein
MASVRSALVTLVNASSVTSVAAAAFLALSYITLKGAGDLRPLIPLLVFAAGAAITLVALNVLTAGVGVELLATAGACAAVWLGATMVERALASSHFEGYAVLMGAIGFLQGCLTLMLFIWRRTKGTARLGPPEYRHSSG